MQTAADNKDLFMVIPFMVTWSFCDPQQWAARRTAMNPKCGKPHEPKLVSTDVETDLIPNLSKPKVREARERVLTGAELPLAWKATERLRVICCRFDRHRDPSPEQPEKRGQDCAT